MHIYGPLHAEVGALLFGVTLQGCGGGCDDAAQTAAAECMAAESANMASLDMSSKDDVCQWVADTFACIPADCCSVDVGGQTYEKALATTSKTYEDLLGCDPLTCR